MDWTETRNVLIVAGVTAERLPVDRQSRIDLSEADLRWADLCRADAADAPEDGDYEDAPAPADSGPLPDDEQVIKETAAEQYLATVAALLDTDADAVKARMKALGYTGISRYVEQRLDTYRLLRDDRPKSLQADLFGDDNAAALATAQDKQS